jgi:3-isopropylmalate/(R)-2-methylmalate dehydratase small subunit
MAGWQTHDGVAVALPLANVDTDQLIPARFMSVPRSEGYGDYLLHDVRRDASGALRPEFPLNQAQQASVLVAGANFGSGSSREAAVYALIDAGYHAVFASSFGDIFASNSVNNGLLPARIKPETYDELVSFIGKSPCEVRIDLKNGQASFNAKHLDFVLDETWRMKLLNGWDDIDLTQQHNAQISAFKSKYAQTKPWAVPASNV